MATRRTFLKASLAGCAASSISRLTSLNAMTQPAGNYRALVCIFLFGGNDSNNTLVTLDTAGFSAYTGIRKNLALSAQSLLSVQTPSKAVYGMHPSLPELHSLFKNKSMAFVANVGSLVQPLTRAQFLSNQGQTPANLFSHADQQAQWQTSIPQGIATSGWAGRVADEVNFLNSPSTFPTFVSVSGNSIMGSGETTRPGSVIPGATLGLSGFDTSAAAMARETGLGKLLTFDSGVTLVHQASQTLSNGIKDSATLSKAVSGAPVLKTVFPATNIGSQLAEVAKLIQVRQAMGMSRQIFFCSLGGFDTHTNQLADQIKLYAQLSPAMSAFFAATQELGVDKEVTSFTESDFSRTLQPNTGGGTDHAWGSHHIVMGGSIKGGDVYGQFPVMELNSGDDAGGEGRWIPSTSIDQYGATLAQWFGVTPQLLPKVFPNIAKFKTNDLGFFG